MTNVMTGDYYKILGVRKTANAEELKKAYRRLAREHHTDRGGDPVVFKAVAEAYGVLSNPTKRREYDSTVGLSTVVELLSSAHGSRALEIQFGGRPMDALPGANRTVNVTVSRELLQKGGSVQIDPSSGSDDGRKLIDIDIPPNTDVAQFLVIPGHGDPGEVRDDTPIPGSPGTLYVRFKAV